MDLIWTDLKIDQKREIIKKSKKTIIIIIFSIISIVMIVVTSYFVINKRENKEKTLNDNTSLGDNNIQSLKEIDFSQLYKIIVLDNELNANIDEERIEYELFKALSAKYFGKIKNGSIKIKYINEKTILFYITIIWLNGSVNYLSREVKIKNIS